MSTTTQKPSILMLPWLAHGHISPFLELAKKLSLRDFHIYFCSTPINLKPLRDTLLAQDCVSSILLIDLHLPSDEFPQLPPHYHTTKDLPPHLMSTLKSAFDSAKSSFFDILKSLKPDLVIFDYLQPWASVAANELNINAVAFLTMGAAFCSFFTHSIHHPFNEYPFSALTLPESEDHRITELMNASANGYKNKERFWECMERSSNVILIKASRVTEGKYVDYLSELVKRKVVTVGPLLQEPANKDGDGEKIMEWLNKRQLSSVVLVSFGSEYFLSEEEREEIAYGLELSNVGFIWVLRFHGGEDLTIHEALPQGFLQRIGDRGLVVEGWAPQAQILGHQSIGGFVSHCGWSSTLEAILFGVPIIAMQMHLDQPLNTKLVVEIYVAMEVDRGSGGFRREELARVIQQVMVKEKGKEAKRNAQESGMRMREKQKEELDDVVEKSKQLIGA